MKPKHHCDLVPQYNKGYNLLELGEYDEAINCFNKVLKVDGTDPGAWNNKGLALDGNGQYEKAIECYDKAIACFNDIKEFDVALGKIWYNKGVTLDNLGRYREAIKSYETSLYYFERAKNKYHKLDELNKMMSIAQCNKGVAIGKSGNHNDALKFLESAIKLNPSNALFWYNKAVALDNLGQLEDAVEYFGKAISFNDHFIEAYTGKGLTCFNLGKYQDAIDCFEKTKTLNPLDAFSWICMGLAYHFSGDYNRAIIYYQYVIASEPNFFEILVSLAACYRKMNNDIEYVARCRIVREMIPKGDEYCEYNRACFEAVCGSPDAALSLLRTALVNKQETADWARRDPDFEFIRDDPRFSTLLDEFSEGEGKEPE